MRHWSMLLVCLLVVSCTRSSYYHLDYWAKPYVPPAAQSAGSDDDIRESVFRYQMAHNASYQKEKAHAYFLAMEDGKDPSAEFLARFSRNATPVKGQSDCNSSSQTPIGVFDEQSGLPGLLLRIDSLNRIGADEAEVEGGCFEGGRSASGSTYRLKFKNGRWTVVVDKIKRLS